MNSIPVVVGDTGSYNCFWQMPFRKSARVEIVNQGEKPISLLYYNIDWMKLLENAVDTVRGHGFVLTKPEWKDGVPSQHNGERVPGRAGRT